MEISTDTEVEPADQPEERGIGARIGIVALNLIAPGLGLCRVGNWRGAVLTLLATLALLALLSFGQGHFPVEGFASAIFGLVLAMGLTAALYIVPMVGTWRQSRLRDPLGHWSRWYGLTAIVVLLLCLNNLATLCVHHFYKPYYGAAESMAPTIGKGDKLVVDMRWRGPPRRGDVIIFQAPDNVRFSRVVAVAGDRIAMRNGIPIINGVAAVQSPRGTARFTGFDGEQQAALFVERLPGEASEHRILDLGPTEVDTIAPLVVPSGTVFVMGDNRDRSADSRVPMDIGGVGMVATKAIVGRPLYIFWSKDRAQIGMRLDR